MKRRRAVVPSAVVAFTLAACGQSRSQPPPPPPEVEFEELIAANADRVAWLDALRPDRGRGCDAEQIATAIEIAAGTYAWDDAISRHPDEPRSRVFQRELADRATARMFVDIDMCLIQKPRPAALALRGALDAALAAPARQTALTTMIDAGGAARSKALTWLTRAPTREMRPRLARLVESDGQLARGAYLASVEIGEAFPASDDWRAWIRDRLVDDQPEAIDALLAAGAGGSPDGAPRVVDLGARQAAMQAAVVALALASGPTPAGLWPAILTLSQDPDPVIRRYAARMMTTRDPEQRRRLDELRHDPDRLVQLTAAWVGG
ncbi:MAG: hypothetical protein IPL61_31310 [Myxococcales bacterium]|nr:hypothetical protein [Myxococcales bacterium]